MYRKELKFIIPEQYLLMLESRLKSTLYKDEHQVGDYYCIRSVYFDSPTDSCYWENRDGVGALPRKKYRIRAYGNINAADQEIEMSDAKISAEIKLRYRDSISKESSDISRELFENIIKGDYSLLSSGQNKVICDYFDKIVGEHFRPKTIVEYKRSAYVYTPGNVRITIDRDIAASYNFENFFVNSLHGLPVMDKGLNVLEVKYDELLPDEIRMLLAGVDLERTSCSKYCLCREIIMDYIRR